MRIIGNILRIVLKNNGQKRSITGQALFAVLTVVNFTSDDV